ncbi:unnamed protein product [Acanthoscelides obtectus]|uniref:Uncharacterized protein n=1 Tax=Acanthoscelides obtectus TaxID=200917 RepID=A0A9P0K881_ACAOB|nr:unnamed protein product [Acanthoscelides obtectus]CAK1633449.1 hypothetical protein AOBTE_LOCUS8144 [Acanthoscelides obtectus]
MAEYGDRFARGFSLHEALAMIEYDKVQADTITLFSPTMLPKIWQMKIWRRRQCIYK